MKYFIIVFACIVGGLCYFLYQVKAENRILISANIEASIQKEALQKQVNLLTGALEVSQKNNQKNAKVVSEAMEAFNIVPFVKIIKHLGELNKKMTEELGKKGMTQEEYDKIFGDDLTKLKELTKIQEQVVNENEQEKQK